MGSGRFPRALGREQQFLRTGRPWRFVERKFVAILCAGLLVTVGALVGVGFLFPRLVGGPPRFSGVHVTLDSDRVGGEPGMNTSTIWTARITSVSSNETLDHYKAGLRVNGTLALVPVLLTRGTLGTAHDVLYDFIEQGAYCLPTPCPPPEGPDGRLNVDDYFRISNASPATAYTIELYWTDTNEVVGQITILT